MLNPKLRINIKFVTLKKCSNINLEQPLTNNSEEPAGHCLLSWQQLKGIVSHSEALLTPQHCNWNYKNEH